MMRAALVLLGIVALSYFALQATNTDVFPLEPAGQPLVTTFQVAEHA